MNENRRASLTSYAWLAALATLLALFVPLVRASAAPGGGADLAQTEAQAAAAAASTLDAVPESATNQTAESHTVQVTFDAETGSSEGATINFEVVETTRESGIIEEPASCDTDAEGTCTSGPYTAVEAGKDIIRAYHDADGSGTFDEGDEASDLVSKTWVRVADPAAVTTRLEGITRIQTAIDISQDLFPDDGTAPAAVLARADVYADALAGAPFADEQEAPVLLTFPDHLYDERDNADRHTEAELQRLLGDDTTKTVYLLGGEDALSLQVQADVQALGYQIVRIEGPTRIETAIQIADAFETPPDNLLVTTAYNFPDALSAGAAAAADHVNGAVLLTTAGDKHPATQAYLADHPGADVYAIGGPTVNPYAEAAGEDDPDTDESIYGPGRIETAVFAAEFFFTDPTDVGVARADDFPDSLTGGRHIADQGAGGPIILTKTDHLHVSIVGEPDFDAARRYLCANADTLTTAWIYGGQVAVADHTEGEVEAAINGEPDAEDGCTFDGEWDRFPGRPDTHFGEPEPTTP